MIGKVSYKYTGSHLTNKLLRMEREFEYADEHWLIFRSLTNRERQVIQMLSRGFNNPEIAESLFISRSTVEQHRKNINRKLNLNSVAKVIRFAYAFDLV